MMGGTFTDAQARQLLATAQLPIVRRFKWLGAGK